MAKPKTSKAKAESVKTAIQSSAGAKRILKPTYDATIARYSGYNIRTDEEALFAAGKGWDDLKIVERDPRWIASIQQRIGKSAGADWNIEAASEDERDLAAAETIETIFKTLKIRDLIEKLLNRAIGKGFAPVEVIWNYSDGKLIPKQLWIDHPQWFRFDEDGTPLHSPDGYRIHPIPDYKLLLLQHQAEDDKPHGLKLLAVCYFPVYLKRHAKKFEAIYAEKFGMPAPIATYNGETSPEDIEKLDEILQNWAADMGIKIPDSVKIEILESVAKGTAPYDAIKKACDREITNVILGGSLTLEASSEGGKGTQALGEVHQDSLQILVDDDTASIEDLFNELIEWIVTLNDGPQQAYPTFKLHSKPKPLDKEHNENLRAWHAAGLPIAKNDIYEAAQIQAPAEDEDILSHPPAPLQSGEGGQGNPTPDPSPQAGRGDNEEKFSDVLPPKRGELEGGQFAASIDLRAKAASAESLRQRNELIDDAVALGLKRFSVMISNFEAMLNEADRVDEMDEVIDGADDAERYQRAINAMARYECRLLLHQAKGVDQLPLSKTQRNKLIKTIAKGFKVEAAIAEALADKPRAPELLDTIFQSRLYARLLGEERIDREVEAQLGDGFAENYPPPSPPATGGEFPLPARGEGVGVGYRTFADFDIAPIEAIQALKKRRAVGPERWQQMTAQERAAAFSYAHAPNFKMVQRARGLLQEALAEGLTYNEWREALDEEYAKLGIKPLADHYAQTVFNTNILSAYGRGRFEQVMNPALDPYVPYLGFVTAGDEAVRPEHAFLEGVYRRDDVFWSQYWPPLDFNCRCNVEVYTEGRFRESGLNLLNGKDNLKSIPEDAQRHIAAGIARGFGDTNLWRKAS